MNKCTQCASATTIIRPCAWKLAASAMREPDVTVESRALAVGDRGEQVEFQQDQFSEARLTPWENHLRRSSVNNRSTRYLKGSDLHVIVELGLWNCFCSSLSHSFFLVLSLFFSLRDSRRVHAKSIVDDYWRLTADAAASRTSSNRSATFCKRASWKPRREKRACFSGSRALNRPQLA